LGRFCSRDPIGISAEINLYEYAGDDPLTRTDPHGTSWLSEWWHYWFPVAAEGPCHPVPVGPIVGGLECVGEMMRAERVVALLRFRRDHEIPGTPAWNFWDIRLRNALRMLDEAKKKCAAERTAK
jgi:hypothetical protein